MNMSVFEIGMLVAFGFSWPISIIKTLRTKHVSGKSPLFMIIIMLGYVSGILHKIFNDRDFVLWLYVLNLLMVGFDLLLYLHYRKKN